MTKLETEQDNQNYYTKCRINTSFKKSQETWWTESIIHSSTGDVNDKLGCAYVKETSFLKANIDRLW